MVKALKYAAIAIVIIAVVLVVMAWASGQFHVVVGATPAESR